MESSLSSYHKLLELLTRQEIKILKLVSEGFSNKEIAEKLILSEGTVKKHREHIYRKCDVRGATGIRRFLRQTQYYFEHQDAHFLIEEENIRTKYA